MSQMRDRRAFLRGLAGTRPAASGLCAAPSAPALHFSKTCKSPETVWFRGFFLCLCGGGRSALLPAGGLSG